MSDKKKSPPDKSPFTMDPTSTGLTSVPSLTKLLNRKSLKISKSSEPPTPPPAPPQTATSTPPVAPPIAQVPGPQPPPQKRRGRGESLIEWNTSQLKSNQDPLGQGIAMLLEKGAISILYLAPQKEEKAVPRFHAKSWAGNSHKKAIWTGVTWDPSLFSEIWQQVIQSGYAELPPPDASTNQMSARNVIRGAFGTTRSEWLLLVRAGPEKGCRGMLAIISPESMIPVFKPGLTMIWKKSA